MCASTVFPRESEDLVTGKELHQELGGFGEMLPYHPTRADMPYTHVLCTTLMVCVVLCQEPVAGSLEQLWMSYNMVEKLKGITVLKNLKVKKSCSSCECYSVLCNCVRKCRWKQRWPVRLHMLVTKCVTANVCWMPVQVLYMGNNLVKDWGEFMKLVGAGAGEVAVCA